MSANLEHPFNKDEQLVYNALWADGRLAFVELRRSAILGEPRGTFFMSCDNLAKRVRTDSRSAWRTMITMCGLGIIEPVSKGFMTDGIKTAGSYRWMLCDLSSKTDDSSSP